MSLKLLDKLSPPCDSDDLGQVVCDDDVSLPQSMEFNGRLVMISENGYHSLQRQKGEVVFVEEDESSDKVELLFPVDSISRGFSISSCSVQRVQLRFDIVSTRVCEEESNRKHVVYTMVVVKTEELDNDKAVVERRYSDFIKLHKELKKIAPELLSKVQMPKKVIGKKNFESEVIQERSRNFEKFLLFVYTVDVVRKSKAFKEFFYFPDLKRACSHIRGGRFVDSLRLLLNALHLQQKLGDGSQEIVATLGSIVVAYENTGHYKEAEQYAAAALDMIKHNVNSAYLIPLLSTRAELCWRIGKDKQDIEKQLKHVQQVSGIEVENAFTLRELAVSRYEENYD